jgi:hypothetical protein
MRISAATFTGVVALAAVAVQGAPSSNQENWRPLGRALSFALGHQGWGEGWHQAL